MARRLHLQALLFVALLLAGWPLCLVLASDRSSTLQAPPLKLPPEWQAVEAGENQRLWRKNGSSAVITLNKAPVQDQTSDALSDSQWLQSWKTAQKIKQRALSSAGLRHWRITSQRLIGTGLQRQMLATGSYLGSSGRQMQFIELSHASYTLLYSEERDTALPRTVESELLTDLLPALLAAPPPEPLATRPGVDP